MADDIKKPTQPELDEVATWQTDPELFSGFLRVLENPDKVLRLECGGDIRIYDDIARDGRIASNLRTIANAIVGKEWRVVPFSEKPRDVRIADYVTAVLKSMNHDQSRRAMLRGGILKGFAVGEIMWDSSEGDVTIAEVKYRHQRRFQFNLDGHLMMLRQGNILEGEDVTVRDGYELRKFQVCTFGDECETPYGRGLGFELYWPWWFGKNALRFWLLFNQKFAGPTVAGEYPSGADPQDKIALKAAAMALHSNSVVTYPAGMVLKLIEAARAGNADTYWKLLEYLDTEKTLIILGQTATTQGTAGKMGDEKTRETVKDELVKAYADQLCESWNRQTIRWLVDYQFPGATGYPQVWIQVEPEENLKTLAERDQILTGIVQVPESYFYNRYDIPAPKEGEKVVGGRPAAPQQLPIEGNAKPGAPASPPTTETPAFSEGAGLDHSTDIAAQDLLGQIMATITNQDMQGQAETIFADLIRTWNQTADPDLLTGRVAELFDRLDMTQVQAFVQKIIFIADLIGLLAAQENK